MDGVVERDLGDELGDEAGIGLSGVDAVLEEVEGEALSGKSERGSVGEELVLDGGFVRNRRCERVKVASQCGHRRRRSERLREGHSRDHECNTHVTGFCRAFNEARSFLVLFHDGPANLAVDTYQRGHRPLLCTRCARNASADQRRSVVALLLVAVSSLDQTSISSGSDTRLVARLSLSDWSSEYRFTTSVPYTRVSPVHVHLLSLLNTLPVDDGTAVVDCVLRHPQPTLPAPRSPPRSTGVHSSKSNPQRLSPKKARFEKTKLESMEPPPPITERGYPVRVIGRVARHYQSKQVHADTIGTFSRRLSYPLLRHAQTLVLPPWMKSRTWNASLSSTRQSILLLFLSFHLPQAPHAPP